MSLEKKETRQMTGKEPLAKTKTVHVPEKEKLLCKKDSDMPGVGLFRGGDIISDPVKIKKIGDNPNFEKTK